MRKRKGKPLKVYLHFKEDLPEKIEDALWEQLFDLVGLFDVELGEDLQKGENIRREP